MHSAKTSGFLNSFKEDGSVPENSLLATSDVVELDPIIPPQNGLHALYIKLHQRKYKKNPMEDLLK